jgi:hypothetical protein
MRGEDRRWDVGRRTQGEGRRRRTCRGRGPAVEPAAGTGGAGERMPLAAVGQETENLNLDC